MIGAVVTGRIRWAALAVLALIGVGVTGEQPGEAAAWPEGTRVWDTVLPLRAQGDLANRAAWRAVEPGAASGLRGDVVIESGPLGAAFASRLGKVFVYSASQPAQRRAEVAPGGMPARGASLSASLSVKDDAIAVDAVFRGPGAGKMPVRFSLAGDGIVRVAPGEGTGRLTVAASLAAAIVPSFVGDDLIYDARDYSPGAPLSLPSEHVLLGLLDGEASMMTMTWQDRVPSVQLIHGEGNCFSAVNFTGGQGISLALLDAAGIWHREPLNAQAFLERDVAISWQPPFPAVWLTQLYEDEVKTTFEFRRGRERTWRGGVGFYAYPVWFSEGKTMFSLGKKIPPEGDAIIYFIEGNEETPANVLTPANVARRTLSGEVLAGFLDEEGRESWFPEREDHVLGAATCAVTDALKEIFDSGQEVEKQDLVRGGVEDMYYYLERMLACDARFYPFAQDIIAYCDAQAQARTAPSPYLGKVRAIAEEILVTYDRARGTIRDMDWAHELGDRTIALAAEKRPDNAQRMVELKQDWTSMGGALEEIARKEHTLTRKLHQQAGYGAVGLPAKAMPVAEEIRRRARACLEHPESYEMWANY